MHALQQVAPAFVAMAHRTVWCSAASVDTQGRPRSRVLHPIWEWNGTQLVGWVGTEPTKLKQAHLAAHPFMSINYWHPTHETCLAECRTSLHFDEATRTRVWELFRSGPEPVGYDPTIIPGWVTPMSERFAVLRLEPWRLRTLPATIMSGQGGEVLTWQEG